MYGFRHVSRRRTSVASALRPEADPQSKLKATNISSRTSDRLKMRVLLFLTLGLILLCVLWQAKAAGTTQGLRLHLGAQGKRKFSIGTGTFYIDGQATRLISCECAFAVSGAVCRKSCHTVRLFVKP